MCSKIMNVEVVNVSEYIEGHKFTSLETITCYPLSKKLFINLFIHYVKQHTYKQQRISLTKTCVNQIMKPNEKLILQLTKV